MLSVPEAAQLKNVHPHSVRQAIKERRLPAEKKGNMWLITRKDLDAWTPRAPRLKKTSEA